ncbi:MAG TPA: twin-arginine translocase TatA/TatE family subunit [Solirubrobacteraceae bacterium]|nr:twin-arginine translocase TatA/TatE family subunit [Solirubrobacteraceae bacterium]
MGLDNPLHIAFLLILLLLVFGAKRLPEMGKSLGHGMRGFKDALSGEEPHAAAAQPFEQPSAAGAPVAQPTLLAAEAQHTPTPTPTPLTGIPAAQPSHESVPAA